MTRSKLQKEALKKAQVAARLANTGRVCSLEPRNKIGLANKREVIFFCFECGKKSVTKPSAYLKKKKHFCSQDCYTEYKKNLPKEMHPNFGKGMSLQESEKRIKARSILNHAVRDGKIVRGSCKICGKKAEAHHENYDKPLEIEWFCFKHHRKIHGHKVFENPEMLKGENK